jgi:hypothetical protein
MNPEQELIKQNGGEIVADNVSAQETSFVSESRPQSGDKRVEQDEKKIAQIREDLGIIDKKEDKKNVPKTFLRPRDEWARGGETSLQSNPLSLASKFLKLFAKKDGLSEQLRADRGKYREVLFDYKIGSGVEGWEAANSGILAKGFRDCSGLVFQTKDAVSIIHISPNVIRDPSDGGDLIEDVDLYGHIRSALKMLLADGQTRSRTSGETVLSGEEVQKIQEMIDSGDLKSTMLAGEEKFVPSIIPIIADGPTIGLPSIKTSVHYVGDLAGAGGYAVYVNPENLYFIGANNKVLKAGVNLPPAMFEFTSPSK